MKKSLVALAVLAGFAGAAAAQSSVTLFGVIDVAARYTKANGQNVKQLTNDGSSSSRFGVRGVEDLGGGLKAGFWLESALSADTGTADSSRFWGRRASVSLMGDFGEVRLGRGKTSTRLVVDDFDVYSTTGLGDVTRVYNTLGSSTQTINRADNLAQYFLPGGLGGAYGSFDVAAGEGAVGAKSYGGRLGWKDSAINVAAGYQSTEGVATAKFKQISLGASYDFGMAKVSGLWSQLKFNSLKQNIYTIGAVVPVTTAGSVLAQFSDAETNSAADRVAGTAGDAKFYTVGYLHNLSKRTSLYTTASLIDNSGLAAFKVQGNAVNSARGGKSGGFDVGIKHSF
ncbi:porin [Roseateles depolymerans]|uniref:Gram-negative type outer membrane porin protein n=1 Tax=Roseateles depolymerans TaxID=76731 RepID=A0A0U3M9Z3_9BURK|nr:porin [Roseateles depolymerans]ALV05453.1 Gram-negative type outer membrane porin protein [Roseateles depolymerans]REG14530.1 putative porin [Roseateles depolymerans]